MKDSLGKFSELWQLTDRLIDFKLGLTIVKPCHSVECTKDALGLGESVTSPIAVFTS